MRAALVAGLTLIAGPVGAQEGPQDDWTLVRDARQRIVTAFVGYQPGPGLMVRCNHGSYEAAIVGLPAAAEGATTRPLKIGFRDEEVEEATWNVGVDPSIAVADYPAPFARELRLGGRFTVAVPGAGEGGRTIRYEVELPPSPAAIDTTLTECDRPLTDDRDGDLPDIADSGLPPALTWARSPIAEYPSQTKYAGGWAVVSCVARENGRLDDCIVESEVPYDGGFGEEAIRAARRGRVASQPGVEMPRRVGFRVRFAIAR